MEWDTAAGHAIILNQEEIYSGKDSNKQLEYNKENLLNPSFIAYSSYL